MAVPGLQGSFLPNVGFDPLFPLGPGPWLAPGLTLLQREAGSLYKTRWYSCSK